MAPDRAGDRIAQPPGIAAPDIAAPARRRMVAADVVILSVLGLALGMASIQPRPARFAEHQAQCAGKEGWSDPAPPVRIFGNVYDVGTCGIVVLLVTGDAGAVVIDGATAAAVPVILANIRRLGLRPHDVKLLLSTHEHGDHAAGLHDLKRLTGAHLLATGGERPALETGIAAPDDPQRTDDRPTFRGVAVDGIVRDGGVVRLGSLRITAHATPGHAPGSTSWSWRSCERAVCHDIVYADSLTAIASDGYRFRDHPAYVQRFEASIDTVATLRCDLIVTPHPAASALYERLGGAAPLVDRAGCERYATTARRALDERLASERQ